MVALTVVLLLFATPTSLLALPTQAATTAPATADAPVVAQEVCAGGCAIPGGLSVASIFPLRSDRELPERSEPEVIGLHDDRAGELFEVLSADTARQLLQQLSQEPQTATELAETVDTSLQNVHYHLENLEDAGAIEEIAVDYSSRGREMSVYAAVYQPMVLVYDG